MSPVYHWKEARILANIAIAFKSLTCAHMLSCGVAVQQRAPMSEGRIRKALRQVEVTVVENPSGRQRYGIPMPLTQDAKKLYKLMQTPYLLEPFLIG